ncbi:MAG TPA: type II secretion system F family protein [Egicoccus sp.]|nr:type II secretion system F family protein [Egicoccus sp.]HSK22821.1 type II secretion system F family protein [Egicoccus sp.]
MTPSPPLLLVATLAVLLVALLGIWQLIQVALDRADLARRSELARVEYEASRWRSRADALLRRTSAGAKLETAVSRAGVDLSALDLALVGAGAMAAGALALALLGPDVLGVLGALVGLWAVRQWLERKRQARLEEFVAQLPELARTLSNATAAGRSLHSALTLAATDLSDPAGTELRLVAEQLRLGASVDAALDTMKQRLPSRELAVLVSTLVIQQRSGGDVVTALRAMAETLEDRKDLRREVKTIVASAVQTGYVTGGLGVLLILMVDRLQGGMIDLMARETVGQLALAATAGLYVFAFALVRRMTDIDV